MKKSVADAAESPNQVKLTKYIVMIEKAADVNVSAALGNIPVKLDEKYDAGHIFQ